MSSLTAARTAPRPAPGHTHRARPTGRRPARAAGQSTRRHGRATSTPATSRVRLTGRGRVLLLLVLVALMLSAFAVGRSASSQATSRPTPAPAATPITVMPGDTLWSVAERLAPARDPRELVAQIRRLNHLPTAALQAGQQLLVPAAA